jgi:hypothetical protein
MHPEQTKKEHPLACAPPGGGSSGELPEKEKKEKEINGNKEEQ